MSNKRFTEEFKIEAVRQVVDRGYSVADVAKRIGTTTHSLYAWKNKYGPDSEQHQEKTQNEQEIRRLKKELRRVTEERDILKKAAVGSTSPNEVHLYPGEQHYLASAVALSVAGGPSQWVLCLAPSTEVCS